MNSLDKAKRGEMLKTLNNFKWNISAACKYLGISRATYYRNKDKYKLERPNASDRKERDNPGTSVSNGPGNNR